MQFSNACKDLMVFSALYRYAEFVDGGSIPYLKNNCSLEKKSQMNETGARSVHGHAVILIEG